MNSDQVTLIAGLFALLVLVGVITPSTSSSNGRQRAEERESNWYRE